jgi:Flp pilus assembly protein TadD
MAGTASRAHKRAMSLLSTAAKWLGVPFVAAFGMPAAYAQYTAQPVAPAPGQLTGFGPASDLSRYLAMLADDPDSVAALAGAGKAALELGDGEAALNFFGRADVLSPRDGTVKAGIAAGLVLMEQAQAAMPLFDEAIRLGIPVSEIAAYRGLAYDLMGDPARGQQDYRLALRRRDDAEVRRRLALSLAISGQRDAALITIDDQLRRQDRAAWRVRAFILALTGDPQGANRVVEAAMPYQAAAMAPFLARLPSLSLADRALAVHFGHFPGDPSQSQAQATAIAQTAPPLPARSDSITAAGRPDASQPPLGQPARIATSAVPVQTPSSGALAGIRSAQASSTPAPAASPPAPPLAAPATGGPVATRSALAQAPTAPLPAAKPTSPVTPPLTIAPPKSPVELAKVPGSTARLAPAPAPVRLADVASVLSRLSDTPAPGKAAADKGKAAAGKTARKAEPAPPKEPSRIWVQIARSRSSSGLAGEFRRIKAKAPKLFAGKTAWTADQGGTNRLLVGPFKSDKEARAFVNQLSDEDVDAFSWTSAQGQEIEKLPAK